MTLISALSENIVVSSLWNLTASCYCHNIHPLDTIVDFKPVHCYKPRLSKMHFHIIKFTGRLAVCLKNQNVSKNHWVYGRCPSSGILNKKKARFEYWIYFRLQVSGDTYSVVSWTVIEVTYIQGTQQIRYLHLATWRRKQMQLSKHVFL
jgi:hypothetical protein